MNIKRLAGIIALFLCAIAPAFAQGPTQTKINFSITTPFELKKGSGYILPAGNYILFRFEANNRNLFALYRDSMRHSPIAMIQTAPVLYTLGWRPGHTKLLMSTDESSPQTIAVLDGWNVPGEDGWEVISTVTRHHGFSTKVR